MWTIILAPVLGGLLGYLNILPKKIYDWTDKLTMLGLIILLFAMGLGIGSNSQLLNNIEILGIEAFVLALGSVLGSIIFTWYVQKWIFRGEDK